MFPEGKPRVDHSQSPCKKRKNAVCACHLYGCLMFQCYHNTFAQVAHVTVIDAGRHNKRIQFPHLLCVVVANAWVLSEVQKWDNLYYILFIYF